MARRVAAELGRWDITIDDSAGQKLADTPEGDGSMLDNTLILFGCSNSKTHVNRNYPLMMAGGRNLGIKQGQFHEMEASGMPLSNLLLTCLQKLDVPAERFSDSSGIVNEALV